MSKGNKIFAKVLDTVKKYKFAVLILVIGLVLLMLPNGGEKEEQTVTETEQPLAEDYAAQMEARLAEMLSQIDGAGAVNVMLTLEGGARTEYQTDVQRSTDTDEKGTKVDEERKTVILSTGSAYDEAAVTVVTYPTFQGALVICEGADSVAVRYELIQAVAALTGLSSDRITVVKMK